MSDHVRAIKFGEEKVEHIAQSSGGVTDAMRKVQPAFRGLDGRGSKAVLYLFESVVFTVIDDGLLINHRVFHTRGEAPADSSTLAGLDELILGAGVESVLAIYKFRMEHHVPLLRRMGFQIGEPLPTLQILGSRDAALRDGRGSIP